MWVSVQHWKRGLGSPTHPPHTTHAIAAIENVLLGLNGVGELPSFFCLPFQGLKQPRRGHHCWGKMDFRGYTASPFASVTGLIQTTTLANIPGIQNIIFQSYM